MKSKKKLAIKDHYYKIIPLALLLLIVPCIVYLKTIPLSGAALDLSISGDTSYNFFSYYKSIWLYVFTILSVVFCIFYMQNKEIKLKLPIIFIPLVVFYVCTFLSSSFSEYKDVAFGGFTDRNEGFFVITCYVLICFMAASFVTYEKDIKILFGAIIVCGFILGIIGISQFWNFDFFQTSLGKHIILSKENYNLIDRLSFKFPKQYIYSTLFNPNYVGSFFTMLLPLSIAFAIFSKKVSHKIISCIFSCVCFINLVGSLSLTGNISTAFAVILLITLFNKNFFKAWRTVLILSISFIIILFCMNNVTNGTILPDFNKASSTTAQVYTSNVQLKPVNSSAQQSLKAQTLQLQTSQSAQSNASRLKPQYIDVGLTTVPQANTNAQTENKRITDFSLDNNVFKIYMDRNIVNITYVANDNTCTFTDASGKNIETEDDAVHANKIIFVDPRYKSLNITFTNNFLNINCSNLDFNIAISQEEKVFKFVDAKGKLVDIDSPESIGFKGSERWASSRGYIWSRSFPLIKDTLLIGHGPDTYALYFPQNEFDGKFKAFDSPHVLVDKPHNMYLQMAINTGVISLVAFIVFVLWFIIGAIKLYIKPKAINSYYVAGVACVTAVVGYLFAGLANDSIIGVSAVFWILLGLGIACNRLYAKSILVPATTNVQPNKKIKK